MKVRFWGVRGSIAVSGPDTMRTGGNTSCVEVQHAGERLILDGGTGLRALGDSIGFRPIRAHLLFSHVHWDHIQGVPFFTPAFHPDAELTFVGASRESGGLRDALARQMKPPQFPIGLDALSAQISWMDLKAEPIELGPFRVTPVDLQHPDGILAFRIEAGGSSMVYATDVEHGARIDKRLVMLSEGADLLVHDAQYTHAEYLGEGGPPRRGWGHSTWEQAVDVARQAEVGRLALFHHDPRRSDDDVAVIEAQARTRRAHTFAAREGAMVAL